MNGGSNIPIGEDLPERLRHPDPEPISAVLASRDLAIEAAAKAMYEADVRAYTAASWPRSTWVDLTESQRDGYRRRVRAEAVLSKQPQTRGMPPVDDLTHYMQATSRERARADESEARATALAEALRTLANPNPEEHATSAYVRRMADFARAALSEQEDTPKRASINPSATGPCACRTPEECDGACTK